MKYLIFTIIILFAVSCNTRTGDSDIQDASKEETGLFKNEADTLRYSIRHEEYTYPAHGKKTDPTYVKFSYPVYAGNREDIDSFLNGEVSRLLDYNIMSDDTSRIPRKQIVENFFKEYTEYLKEKPEYIMSYGLENSIQPLHRFGNIVSLSSFSYIFTGGAHPSHTIFYSNFDILNKRRLKNSSIIDLTNLDLKKIAEKYFRIQNEIPMDSSFSSSGYFWEGDGHKEGEFYLNENFGFHKDSITWLYNSYEICGYAFGNPSIQIPINEVEKHIRK